MPTLRYALNRNDYTWKNALFWGNFIGHCKKIKEGRLGNRLIHLLIAAAELLPIVSQIASIAETILVKTVKKNATRSGSDLLMTRVISPNNKNHSSEASSNTKSITFSNWLEEKRKQIPEYKGETSLEAIRSWLREKKVSIARIGNKTIAFKVKVEYVRGAGEAIREVLSEFVVGVVLWNQRAKEWTSYETSENVHFKIKTTPLEVGEKNMDTDTPFVIPKDTFDNYPLFRSFNETKDEKLSPKKLNLFANTEQQDRLPEDDQRSLVWLMYRLISRKSVQIADVGLKLFKPKAVGVPKGYWKIRLAD